MPAICAGSESDSNTTNDDPVSAVASPCAKPTPYLSATAPPMGANAADAAYNITKALV